MEMSQPPRRLMLSDLPTEILQLILSNFCLHCHESDGVPLAHFPRKRQALDQPSWYSLDRQALYSACLVSRRFRDIAQPILYHEFVPGYGSSHYSERYQWTGRFTSFLRTVAQRRDLANLVRDLYFHDWLRASITLEPHIAEAALEESARARGVNLSDFLEPFRGSPTQRLLEPYGPGASELVAMLLFCLPNLTRICFDMDIPFPPIPASALSAAGVRLPLQTIEVDAHGSELRYVLGGVLELSLPTLRTLNVDYYSSRSGDELGISDLFFPSLRKIIISRSEISGPDLQLLLSCCTGLETFIYDTLSSTYCIQPPKIIEYLSRHQETLTAVRLDLRDARIVENKLPFEPMPSLKKFPVLLNVSLNALFIYNDMNEQQDDDNVLCRLLPPSVVLLQLYDTVGTSTLARLSKGLHRLVDAALLGQFPSLKEVRCYVREKFDDDLVRKFVDAGVYLDMILGPPSDVMPHRRSSISAGPSIYTPQDNDHGED
ncbi:hypothetical protein F4861DRAFT_535491 [Xylaria intraflava]|nr:hypothetical protein F4861DRAFT_535491 [Xylaria intraflava]